MEALVYIVMFILGTAVMVTRLHRIPAPQRPRIIDGYLVHVRLLGRDNQLFEQEAQLEVELTDDVSADPRFVVERCELTLPVSYDLLRGAIHQRVPNSATQEELKKMVAFARQLAIASRETREELLQSVLRDDGERRLKSLNDLTRQFRLSAETKRAATAAVIDENPAIRLNAAIVLEEEAIDVVETLVLDEEVPVDLRLQGLKHRERLLRSGYIMLARSLLDSPAIEMREAAIYAFMDLMPADVIDRLTAMLPGADPRIAEAVARAFGRSDAPRSEDALLSLLDRPEEQVVIAAAQALSRVGSAGAISRLVITSRREPLEEITREVLFAAIEVLKDDRRPSPGGHLSLAASGSEARGGLSLEGGSSLSFPEDP